MAPGEELRVLVSTDVLSDGQNLQDSRIVVNDDLPWAVVRLVQRAGRVDRIGQQAAINERPLLESATQRFANAIRERSPTDVAALLVELWRDDRLCVPPEDAGPTEPSIICSMGLQLQQTGG